MSVKVLTRLEVRRADVADVVRTAVYCLHRSVVGSELSIQMFSVYDGGLLLPVGVVCEFCFCV